jgi:hypothetical protein
MTFYRILFRSLSLDDIWKEQLGNVLYEPEFRKHLIHFLRVSEIDYFPEIQEKWIPLESKGQSTAMIISTRAGTWGYISPDKWQYGSASIESVRSIQETVRMNHSRPRADRDKP